MSRGMDSRIWADHSSHEAEEETITGLLPVGYKQDVWKLITECDKYYFVQKYN